MIYWIGANSGTYRWAAVLSAAMAIAFIALNFALFGWTLGFILRKHIPMGIYWAPILWVMVEFLRSFGTLSMPWVNLSLSQVQYLPAIQIAGMTGMYGVSWWVVLLNVILYKYLLARDAGNRSLQLALAGVGVYLLPIIYGTVVLQMLPGHNQGTKPLTIAVIQPNIDPNQKWDRKFRSQNIAFLDSLTYRAIEQHPDIVVWPETATPSYLRYNTYGYQTHLQHLVDSIQTPILTGTPDWEPAADSREKDKGSYYNGAILVEPAKEMDQVYRKIKLVPFAEYVPYSWLFGFFYKLDLGQGKYTPGGKYTVFEYKNHKATKMSVAICYDSSFPGLVRRFRERGAQWLAIITNDAWFGNTSGPYQHAAWAQMRAVETRIPVARSANTGVSMLIDGWGRVNARLPLNTQGTLAGTLETALPQTFYAKFGDLFSLMMTVWGLTGLGWAALNGVIKS